MNVWSLEVDVCRIHTIIVQRTKEFADIFIGKIFDEEYEDMIFEEQMLERM